MPYLVNALSQHTPRRTRQPSSASLSPARSMATSEPLCRSSFLECAFLILYTSCFKGELKFQALLEPFYQIVLNRKYYTQQ